MVSVILSVSVVKSAANFELNLGFRVQRSRVRKWKRMFRDASGAAGSEHLQRARAFGAHGFPDDDDLSVTGACDAG